MRGAKARAYIDLPSPLNASKRCMPIRPLPRLAPPTMRNMRWASGLVLIDYVVVSLLNHAMSLVSLASAEAVLRFAQIFWQSEPGTPILYEAMTHMLLALQGESWRRKICPGR